MTRGPTTEKGLVNAMVRGIREEYPDVWLIKVHGGPYQEAGVPDLIGCVRGRMFAIEAKLRRPGESAPAARARTSPRQRVQIERLLAAGASAGVALSVEEALGIVRQALR